MKHTTVTLGRREDCTFRVPLPDVSRMHCRLHTDLMDGTVQVHDLGSANGTYVNFRRVRSARLSPGDVMAIGPARFIVSIGGLPDPQTLKRLARKLCNPTLAEDPVPTGFQDGPGRHRWGPAPLGGCNGG